LMIFNAMGGPATYSPGNPPPEPPNLALAIPSLRTVPDATSASLVRVNANRLLGLATGSDRVLASLPDE
jgi:hypothetical protein